MIRVFLILLCCGGLFSSHAAALESCSVRYRQSAVLDLKADDTSITDHLNEQRIVFRKRGLENTSIGTSTLSDEPVLTVVYPKGSINPGSTLAPSGGDEFFWPGFGPVGVMSACLSYRLRFAPGFQFAKGGKLPGLYGTLEDAVDTRASGCRRASDGRDFTARLMWRRGGAGEVYAYAANRPGKCGWSLGRGAWQFHPGKWTIITQEIVLNTPGQTDGVVRLWIDDMLVLEKFDLHYRDTSQTTIKGLFFSTFFGGNDESWASPRTQSITFTDFRLFAPY